MTSDLTELLGNHYKLLELLPDYDDGVWLKVETEDNFCLLDNIKCDVSFCKKAVRYELARLSEIEKTTDKVTADWSERCQKLEAERDRLLALATRRGARMQKMREWMNGCRSCETCGDLSSTTDWYEFMQEHPDAGEWFDEDSVPVDA